MSTKKQTGATVILLITLLVGIILIPSVAEQTQAAKYSRDVMGFGIDPDSGAHSDTTANETMTDFGPIILNDTTYLIVRAADNATPTVFYSLIQGQNYSIVNNTASGAGLNFTWILDTWATGNAINGTIDYRWLSAAGNVRALLDLAPVFYTVMLLAIVIVTAAKKLKLF